MAFISIATWLTTFFTLDPFHFVLEVYSAIYLKIHFVWECTCVRMCSMCMFVCTSAHCCKIEKDDYRVHSSDTLPWDGMSHWTWSAIKPHWSCLPPPCSVLRLLEFIWGCRDLNSGLCVAQSAVLSTEPFMLLIILSIPTSIPVYVWNTAQAKSQTIKNTFF